jgi:hypothetical protein
MNGRNRMVEGVRRPFAARDSGKADGKAARLCLKLWSGK